MTRTWTRLSLLYPASYLLSSGAGLLLFSSTYLKLLLARGEYGDVFPRVAGALIFALGVIVVQVVRHRVEALYATLTGVRLFLCACWAALYLGTGDPFFLVLLGVVGFGVLLSTLAARADAADRRVAELSRG